MVVINVILILLFAATIVSLVRDETAKSIAKEENATRSTVQFIFSIDGVVPFVTAALVCMLHNLVYWGLTFLTDFFGTDSPAFKDSQIARYAAPIYFLSGYVAFIIAVLRRHQTKR